MEKNNWDDLERFIPSEEEKLKDNVKINHEQVETHTEHIGLQIEKIWSEHDSLEPSQRLYLILFSLLDECFQEMTWDEVKNMIKKTVQSLEHDIKINREMEI